MHLGSCGGYSHISLPLDDVNQLPRILVQLELQFAFLVDDELRGREKSTATLAFVFRIELDFTGGQIEILRLSILIGFAERDPAICKKTNGSAGRGHNFSNEAKIVSNCARDLYPTHVFHFFKS